MKHVSILCLYDATINSIDSSYQLLNRVNDFLRYQRREPFYTVELAGLEKEVSLNAGLYHIRVDKTIDEITQTDVIVIPLLCGDFQKAIEKNERYKNWVTGQYHHNAEIVCLCAGSFFLASTGLLNERQCAVHWGAKMNLK